MTQNKRPQGNATLPSGRAVPFGEGVGFPCVERRARTGSASRVANDPANATLINCLTRSSYWSRSNGSRCGRRSVRCTIPALGAINQLHVR